MRVKSWARRRGAGAVHLRPKRLLGSGYLETLESRRLLSTAGLTAVPNSVSIPSPSQLLPGGYSPAQIRTVYGFDQTYVYGSGTTLADGAGQTIAIVDAYSDPNLVADLQFFDKTFKLPDPPQLMVVSPGGSNPPPDAGWALETSLDVEWAHAIAPAANILLVQGASASIGDLCAAIDFARNFPGVDNFPAVDVVSMSFGLPEILLPLAGYNLQTLDGLLTTPQGHNGVTFVASSGDSGATPAIVVNGVNGVSVSVPVLSPEWPASSPNVVGVGGTSLYLNQNNDYGTELGWSGAVVTGSGGGISDFEGKPAYQSQAQSTNNRTVPDVSYDTDPNTGFLVYDTYQQSGWLTVGGTSAGAPQWAALVVLADQGRALANRGSLDGPGQTLPALYGPYTANISGTPSSSVYTTVYHDIVVGSNFYPATFGYDLVTGHRRAARRGRLLSRDGDHPASGGPVSPNPASGSPVSPNPAPARASGPPRPAGREPSRRRPPRRPRRPDRDRAVGVLVGGGGPGGRIARVGSEDLGLPPGDPERPARGRGPEPGRKPGVGRRRSTTRRHVRRIGPLIRRREGNAPGGLALVCHRVAARIARETSLPALVERRWVRTWVVSYGY
jgi:hypothetical protein